MASLFKKPDGSYWIIEKGKWYKVGKVPASVAKIALGKFENDQTYLRLGMAASVAISFEDAGNEYLKTLPGNRWREKHQLKTLSSIIGLLHKAIPRDVEKFFDEKGYKPNTRRLYKRFICAVFDYAVKSKLIHSHSMNEIVTGTIERTLPRYSDPDLIKKVLSVMPEISQLPYWIMYYTGMRPSEVLRLEGRDIDLKTKTILVRHSKTKRFRVIPLHPALIDSLTGAKMSPAESLFKIKSLRPILRAALKKLGLPEKTLTQYQFRHTFATQVLSETKDLRAVQQLLGHTDIKTTTVYAHALPHALKSAVDSIK